MSISRPPAPLRRRHDAPLIGERAARRGRSVTEGGDAHAGCEEARYRFALQPRRTESNGRNLDAFGGHATAEVRTPKPSLQRRTEPP